MSSAPIKEADDYWRMAGAAFACAQLAYARGDSAARERAYELHRKYAHKWKQAVARATRKPLIERSDDGR